MHSILERIISIYAVKSKEQIFPVQEAEFIDNQLKEEDLVFHHKILKRTEFIAGKTGVYESFRRIKGKFRLLVILFCGVCFILGSGASFNAFDQQSLATVNFYWLVLVLIGFNFLSLMVWLVVSLSTYKASAIVANRQNSGAPPEISVNYSSIRPNILLSVFTWISGLIVTRNGKLKPSEKPESINSENDNDYFVVQAWSRLLENSRYSFWLSSALSHLLWMVYLMGGIVTVLVMLSVREYNFGWATTLLQPETFVSFTQALAFLPEWFGIPVPTETMIINSRLDTVIFSEQINPAEKVTMRTHWASLLLACLFLYGVLPRLLLLLLSRWQFSKAVTTYPMDYTEPYFLELRQRLIPVTRTIGVVDPDTRPKGNTERKGEHCTDVLLPENARYIAVELNDSQDWPPEGIKRESCLGHAEDSDSQLEILKEIAHLQNEPVVCVVPLSRSPDRGLVRFIKEVKHASSSDIYLLISGRFTDSSTNYQETKVSALKERNDRLSDWHQLAGQLQIPSERVIHMSSFGPAV